MIDVIEIKDFFDRDACTAIRAELSEAAGGPATVLDRDAGGSVQPLVRRVTRVAIPTATRARVTQLLEARKETLESHFAVRLSHCEEPQFLCYQPGDFFVAHQDGNTPLIHDESRFRKISAVIFLSAQTPEPAYGSYGGGSLVLYGPYSGPPLQLSLAPPPGTLVCFRAETTHEVTPVTHGERFTIVSWYR